MKTHKKYIVTLFLVVASLNYNIQAGADQQTRFDFYGHFVNISYDYNLPKLNLQKLNQVEFNAISKHIRTTSLAKTAASIKGIAQDFNLDDVGIVLLIDKISQHIFTGNKTNERAFFKYLLLKEIGFDVILTKTGNTLNCMGNTSFVPGRYAYITYGNKTYKDLNFQSKGTNAQHFIFQDNLRTYKVLTRNVLKKPNIRAKLVDKTVAVKFGMDTYEIPLQGNQSYNEYLGDLPPFNLGNNYTTVAFSDEMTQTLLPALRYKMQGLNKDESIKFLLAFVQQCVPYGSDYDKYGAERYYYPEETVLSTSADCEDKAFLFAYLLDKLLEVKSVGLFFEQDKHYGLAVEIPGYTGKDAFKYSGKSYVACEPTGNLPTLGFSSVRLDRVTSVHPL